MANRMDETEYKNLFEQSPIGMAIVDLDDRFILVNETLSQMLGYTPGELSELTLEEITFYRDIDKDSELADQVLAGKIPQYTTEKHYINKNGKIFWANVSVSIVRNETGKPKYKVLTVEDISNRKLDEEALSQSEARFRAIADFAIDAVVSCRKAGTEVAFCNRAAEKVFGYRKEELIGKPLAQIIPERYRGDHSAGVNRYLAEGESGYLGKVNEFIALRKDGSEFPMEMTVGAWRSEDETSFTAIIRDITERKHLERLSQALDSINLAVNSTLDLNEIIKRVVTAAAEAVGADNSTISLQEGDKWRLADVGGRLSKNIDAGFAENLKPIIKLATQLKRSVLVDDALSDPRVSPGFVNAYGLRSFMLSPLFIRGEIVGAISFNFHEAVHEFTDGEIDFANKLAASVSFAVSNARLFKTQRDTANILQEALITVPQSLPGVDLGYLYRSATEAVRVGGDFYDIFELEDDKIGIIIGDVSGKGVKAATLTTIVKNTLKAYALQGDSPALALGKTNDLIYKATQPADFVTLVFLVLNTSTGELVYCNGGHLPPLIRRDDRVEALPVGSMIVGAFPDVTYTEGAGRLNPDDLLILYTDGVTEAKRGVEMFGEDRLLSLVKLVEKPKPAVGAIIAAVYDFGGGQLSDDIAILAIALERG